MRCITCGTSNAEGSRFCGGCGAELKTESNGFHSSSYIAPTKSTPNTYNPSSETTHYSGAYTASRSPIIPPGYEPISMWGYFGYQLLFMIPVIGFIILLVFAFGGTQNINLRNFARSYFCVLIIVIVLFVLISLIGLSSYSALSLF